MRAAIAATNANRPKGALENGEQRWQILANDQSMYAKDYIPLIVGYHNGAAVRLGDIAQVSDSVQDLRNDGLANGYILNTSTLTTTAGIRFRFWPSVGTALGKARPGTDETSGPA